MATTQSYGTYMFIGAVIFVGYIFVSTGNFVEPRRIHVEELDSVELSKQRHEQRSKHLERPIITGEIKGKVQQHKNENGDDHSRQRRSPDQLSKQMSYVDKTIQSMDQRIDQNARQLEEKQKNIQNDRSKKEKPAQQLNDVDKTVQSMDQKVDENAQQMEEKQKNIQDDRSKKVKPAQQLNDVDKTVQSMDQKVEENAQQMEEKQKDKQDYSLEKVKSARQLKSSVDKKTPWHMRVLKSKDKKNDKTDFKALVKSNNKMPIKLSPPKKQPTKKKKKIVRRIRVQKEQKLSEKERRSLEQKLIHSFGKNYKDSDDYKRIIDKCSEYRHHKGRILFYDTSKYIESQPNLCDGEIHILLAVHTRPNNFERRDLIRNTFGSMRYIKGKRIALVFFLGASNDKTINKRILKEAASYQDIVQRDYVEHYRNMTYKHLSVMNWVMEYCPRAGYLVKVDDDVFANIFQVVDYVDTFNPQTFYCTRTLGPKPQRRSGKWKLSYDEYPKSRFPPYCMGYAYLMKASLAKDLYWCSIYSKFLWIDDVHIGGILPQKLGHELVKFISGHDSAYLLPSHGSWKIADHMFLLGTRNELLPDVIRKIWRASLQFSY